MNHVPTALLAPLREEGETCAPDAEEARELLLMACHDVCAPLSAIRLSAQSLRFRIAGGAVLTEERLCEVLERVEQLSDDAARLMSDLLRLERRPPRREESSFDVDLEDALATAISFHAEALRRARCTVVVMREEGLPRVRGRWARPLLESVFSNLLQNVGRHAAGAHVTIDLRRVGGEALIRVSDNGSDNGSHGGPGPDAGAKSQGHGLGMWIIRRAVSELGGRVSIDARAGAGLSVEIALKVRGATAPT